MDNSNNVSSLDKAIKVFITIKCWSCTNIFTVVLIDGDDSQKCVCPECKVSTDMLVGVKLSK